VSRFDVEVVLEGTDLPDDVLDRLFDTLPDALPSFMNGVAKVTAPVDADDPETAALWLIATLRRLLPDARPVRLGQDLVSISGIAERIGRTRESVRLLVHGSRGPGNFPPAVGAVGDGIRVWPWAVVVDWFRDDLGVDLGERGIPPEVAAAVDAWLAGTSISRERGRPAPPTVRPGQRRSA
jgi:hypothetical protein